MRFRASRKTAQSMYEDHTEVHPTDDKSGFFAKGRDFESRYVNHSYTEQEKEVLASYESVDYLPPHSHVYRNWLRQQPARLDWDRWIMMGFIGFATGFIGFLLHQLIDLISDFKWDLAQEMIEDDRLAVAWVFVTGFSLALVLVGSIIVVFLRPSAAGSGLPELIGYLNGALVRHIFNIKTLVVKFFSCACAVGSGLPVGPEGPMIHMGSLVGAGLSQFKSVTMGFSLPFFERFRNPEDRRNFISAGSAAGVASAFGAPVGGLLFAMEEVSSFWSMKLSWQVFFSCMVSTVTTDLFNSAFTSFRYTGQFGLFKADKYILFQVREGLDVNIIMFIPTVVIGIIGGILGAVFVFTNLKLARTRRALIAKFKSPLVQKLVRLLEPCIIIVIMSTGTIFLPGAFQCSPFTCYYRGETNSPDKEGLSPKCLTESVGKTEISVSNYTCPPGVSNSTFSNETFNQVATLLFGTGEEAIHHLFSRETHWEFTCGPLLTVLAFYFILACWSCGPSISAGLVVPMLYIGAIYGRVIGLTMVSMFGVKDVEKDEYWAWMDPGAFALIGAASFFGGVSRLTMSLTVIMMEITNDVQFLLPIMVAIMTAKWVGDLFTHPLYHALLEVKCIPFLDSEPVIMHGKKNVNLELFTARQAMATPPVVVHPRESVSGLARLLIDTTHGGYPMVPAVGSMQEENKFLGIITRIELEILLLNEQLFETGEAEPDLEPEVNPLDYQKLQLIEKVKDANRLEELVESYAENPMYDNIYINLGPYVNHSAASIPESFSLHRTYIIFRTLGLRHLTVVNNQNQVVGIITRKDLMGFKMEEKLGPLLDRGEGNVDDIITPRYVEMSQVSKQSNNAVTGNNSKEEDC